jgi:hypothetical protein
MAETLSMAETHSMADIGHQERTPASLNGGYQLSREETQISRWTISAKRGD